MLGKYLGDSYDMVKRFWSETLNPIAPLYSHPEFVPVEIRTQFTTLTTIPILELSAIPKGRFGVLLDPHTGIPLPSSLQQRMTPSHAPLQFIAQIMEALRPQYIICFDQSHLRSPGFSNDQQKQEKMKYLKLHDLSSFYFVSHASFLFVTESPEVLDAIRNRLVSSGVPKNRFADCQ